MKANKLILPLVIALGAMLATTGCKHGPTKTTVIPGRPGSQTTDIDPSLTPRPGMEDPFARSNDNPFKPGDPIAAAGFDWHNMNQDRAALAAYTVHFQFDSNVVQDKEQAKVASVAQALASDPGAKLLIEGHCDERGTEEYNRALGDRRAGSLREALVHDGVSADRIATISYGKDKPVDRGGNEAAYSKNRRGEFILLHAK
jgi:peptidoglycan-associated lipoprotein